MTAEFDDRVLHAVGELGPCTINMIREHLGIPYSPRNNQKIYVTAGKLVRYRFVDTDIQDGLRVYNIHNGNLLISGGVVHRPCGNKKGDERAGRYQRYVSEQTRKKILKEIAKGPTNITSIAMATGYNYNTIHRHLKRMRNEGVVSTDEIVREGGWNWYVMGKEYNPTPRAPRKSHVERTTLIERIIRENGIVTAYDIKRISGIHSNSIYREIHEMERDGIIIRWGMSGNRTEWRLAP